MCWISLRGRGFGGEICITRFNMRVGFFRGAMSICSLVSTLEKIIHVHRELLAEPVSCSGSYYRSTFRRGWTSRRTWMTR